jgi:hypothetical protein
LEEIEECPEPFFLNGKRKEKGILPFSFCRQCRPLIIIPPRIYEDVHTHTFCRSAGSGAYHTSAMANEQNPGPKKKKKRKRREWSADNLPSIVKVAVREAESA